jgi:hypothetical protein
MNPHCNGWIDVLELPDFDDPAPAVRVEHVACAAELPCARALVPVCGPSHVASDHSFARLAFFS